MGTSFDFSIGDLHGFIWDQGGPIVALNTLVPFGSGLTVRSALDINDRGEITGNGVLPNGDVHAVLLIPCDEEHSEAEAATSTRLTRRPQPNSIQLQSLTRQRQVLPRCLQQK